MKKLEQIINEHRTDLDSFEPGDGHFERFRKKMNKRHYTRITLLDYLKIAAVVLLASLFSFFLYGQVQNFMAGDNINTLSDVSEEYREVEAYYNRMINASYDQLKQVAPHDPAHKAMLLEELNEMDRVYQNLQKDLQAHPGDERVINAMISHYQKKLDIMNQIIIQLESINNHKTKPHESTDI